LASHGHTVHPVALPTTRHALAAYYVLAPAEASSNLARYDGVRFGWRDPDPGAADDRPAAPSSAGGSGGGGSSDGPAVLYAATRGAAFGDEVRRRILLGTFSLSAHAIDNYFLQAQKVRRVVQREFDGCFARANPLLPPPPPPPPTQRRDDTADSGRVDVLVCPTAPSLPPTLDSLRAAHAASPLQAYVNDVFTVPASLAGLPALSVPVADPAGSGLSVGIQVIGQYGDDQLVLAAGEVIATMQGESWEGMM
ncbi:Trimeric GatFAB AmidoTransferase(AdT) complex subunit, partial [Ascosphaera acerosa]